jgi:TolB-like protein
MSTPRKKIELSGARRASRGGKMPAAALACCLLLFGANADRNGAVLRASDIQADNVYARPPKLLASLQRVALLPIACASQVANLPEGCEEMTPVLLDELVRTKKFEVVAVKTLDLRFSTGQPRWTGSEAMPTNFFATLQRQTGCDAVMFCELTEFKPYPPLAIGWRFKLVDVRTSTILWAADEVFDDHNPVLAQNKGVLKKISDKLTRNEEQDWVDGQSPQVFGHKTISAMLKTLPER